MGTKHCDQHGAQDIRFASKRFSGRAESGGDVDDTVFVAKLYWYGAWWICPVDADFLREHRIEVPRGARIVTIEDEARSEALMSHMTPTCRVCLSEFLATDPSGTGIAELFDKS